LGFLKWLYPGMGIKRWVMLTIVGGLLAGVGLDCLFGEGVVVEMVRSWTHLGPQASDGGRFVILGLALLSLGVLGIGFGLGKAVKSVVAAVAPGYGGRFAHDIVQANALKRGPSIVAIGGGTGLSTLLRGLKEYTTNITAIVTVTDDGGSSGRLRTEMGILPPGDIRNCLVALADKEPLMEKLFQYRFKGNTDLNGHNFGNLLIAALTDLFGDFEVAVKESSKVLAIRGRVLPSTLSDVTIWAEMSDGSTVRGETNMASHELPIRRVSIEPPSCRPLPEAIEAIRTADAIVLGPGSLYTSVIPNLLVKELAEAIRKAPAPKIYVCNAMTQNGETDNYSVCDHVNAILEHSHPDMIDFCIVNDMPVSVHLIEKYRSMSQEPVKDDSNALAEKGIRVIRAPVVSETHLVRHDPQKLARVLVRLFWDLREAQASGNRVHQYIEHVRSRIDFLAYRN
jgi:uncharacterized cofD-like protein